MHDDPRVRRLFRLPTSARRVERDIDDELAFHLDARVDDLVAGGMGAAAAREQALREFGDVGEARREIGELDRRRLRRGRVAEWWEGVRQDLRYGARSLWRQPSFLATAMITLGLGIGATTAIFSAVDAVLLRPLPYPGADRLVVVRERDRDGDEMNASGPNVLDWRALGHRLAGVAAYGAEPTTVLGGAEPARVGAAIVSEDFFRVMATRPAIGRGFVAEETEAGGPAAVVVSDRFWREQLAGDPRVEAKSLEVNGRSARVVGVMPEGFAFPAGTDVWLPLDLAHSQEDRTAHNWQVIARMRDGVDPATARADLDAVQRRIKEQYGKKADAVGVTVTTLHDDLVGPARRSLLLLFGAAGLVLLVACTNVASTLLARGSVRRREIEVRSALGASRGRVVRQLFTESLLLALLGAAVGLVTAGIALRALVSLAPAGALPRLAEIRVDGWAVAFAVAMAALAAVLSGLLPALRLAESGSGRTLLLRGASSAGGAGSGWSALVAGEVALAVLLLVGAGLLARSFGQLLRVDPGFRAPNAIAVHLSLPESKYPTDTAVAALYAELLPELGAIPGVSSVGLVNRLPLSGSGLNGAFEVDGRGPQSGWSDYRVASAGYFRAMGIPLRRGRLFDDAVDRAGAPEVVVVSQALADKYWPGEDPVGKRIRDHANDSFHYGRDRWLTVVGVVGDVRDGLTAKATPTVYVSYAQRPFRARDAVVAVAGAVPPSTLVAAVRGRLRDRYASVPAELRTMNAQMAGALDGRRFTMTMLGAFAALALVLAAVGIYGVVSYRVAQRTQEIGIRIALGATAGQVRWVVIADAMGVVVAGLVAGAAGAFALTRLLRGLLYDTSPTDAPTFAGVLVLLLAAGWLASWVPARRATRVDPLVALRAG